jgi:hypothetical protein
MRTHLQLFRNCVQSVTVRDFFGYWRRDRRRSERWARHQRSVWKPQPHPIKARADFPPSSQRPHPRTDCLRHWRQVSSVHQSQSAILQRGHHRLLRKAHVKGRTIPRMSLAGLQHRSLFGAYLRTLRFPSLQLSRAESLRRGYHRHIVQ